MRHIRFFVTILLVLSVFGCASTTRYQDQDLGRWEKDNLLEEEKSPTAATVLGFLPGFGSFYTGQIGMGFLSLLTWPLSILWDPVSGYRGARVANWEATQEKLDKLENNRRIAYNKLDVMHERKEVSEDDYNNYRKVLTAMPLGAFAKETEVVAKINQLYLQNAPKVPGSFGNTPDRAPASAH